jgi:hypothetical protein
VDRVEAADMGTSVEEADECEEEEARRWGTEGEEGSRVWGGEGEDWQSERRLRKACEGCRVQDSRKGRQSRWKRHLRKEAQLHQEMK